MSVVFFSFPSLFCTWGIEKFNVRYSKVGGNHRHKQVSRVVRDQQESCLVKQSSVLLDELVDRNYAILDID